jgi:hypothetical protein
MTTVLNLIRDWYLSFESSEQIIAPLAAYVRTWTPTDASLVHPQHNYLSAESHVLDTLVWLPLLTVQFFYGAMLERRDRANGRLAPPSLKAGSDR